MEKNKLIVGNQKMYMTPNEVGEYLKSVIGKITTSNVVICPSSIYIPYFLKHKFSVGIQNICSESEGAYTGEISAKQVSEFGIKYSLVGHSERRIHFFEDNDLINEKVKKLLEYNIKPILCIGETNEEKNLLKTNKVLKSEIVTCLKGIKPEMFDKIIIAYEPIWAIGTNRIPTMEEIKTNVKYIKEIVNKIYKAEVKVLYGGSINTNNIEKLNKIDCLDGFLIGGSSTNPKEFLSIIEVVVNQ